MPAMRTSFGLNGPRPERDPAAGDFVRLGALVLSAAAMAAPAEAADRSASAPALTVAIVDLAEIPGLAPRRPPETNRPAWRTTFGSERVTQPEIKTGGGESLAALADVDVVLIQGVQVAARLRRLFPPRAWRLVVSRRLLSPADPVGFRTVRADLPPATAVAVKARRDLRITARAFSLALDEPGAERPAADPEAAATAVRLVDRTGRTLWLASVALPAACGAEEPPCPARRALDAWRRERLGLGEPTLIGGRTGRHTAAPVGDGQAETGPAQCASYTIEGDLPWASPAAEDVSSDSPTSCMPIIRLGG